MEKLVRAIEAAFSEVDPRMREIDDEMFGEPYEDEEPEDLTPIDDDTVLTSAEQLATAIRDMIAEMIEARLSQK